MSTYPATLRSLAAAHSGAHCKVCKESFVAFHLPYVFSQSVVSSMQILWPGQSGLASCSVQVSSCAHIPTFEHHDYSAAQHFGVCERCQIDMNTEALDQEVVQGDKSIIAKRHSDNHIDLCFRFSYDDVQQLSMRRP